MTLCLHSLNILNERARASRRARAGVAVQEDRYERMDVDFHERLRAGFQEIAAGIPQRCVMLDGARD